MATPRIGDPHFERTVVLILADAEEGTFGVVLNRPSETSVAELLPGWAEAAAPPAVMFLGGPVARNAVVGLGLHRRGNPDEAASGWQQVSGPVGTVNLNEAPSAAGGNLAGARLFAGSAGWSQGQLEAELAEEAWWVAGLEPADIVSAAPEELWRTVLRRQRGVTAWFANYPPDPLLN